MHKAPLLIIVALLTALSLPPVLPPVSAEESWRPRGCRPYGDYCPRRHGRYGAKQAVHSREEARTILEDYFRDRELTIGPIAERKWFFRAELRDHENNLVDIIIIDKRTGRIRSIL